MGVISGSEWRTLASDLRTFAMRFAGSRRADQLLEPSMKPVYAFGE
jgi:hypothetical protein